MKKSLFYLVISLSLFACHKDNNSNKTNPPPPPNTGNKTYSVKFNVALPSTIKTNSIGAKNNSVVPVSAFANTLTYWVYNSSGNLVTQLIQTASSSPNFGTLSDSFQAGTYQVVIIAQNTSLIPLNPTSNYKNLVLEFNGQDTFLDNYSLTVSDTTSEQNVTLHRVDGQLQVKITDTIPAICAQIEVDVVNDKNYSIPGDSIYYPYMTTKTVTIPDSAVGKPNFIITTYVANTNSPFTVNIYGIKSDGTKYVTATATGVTCEDNVRTLLSGTLPFTTSTYGFTVTFDTIWDGPPTVIPLNSKTASTKH